MGIRISDNIFSRKSTDRKTLKSLREFNFQALVLFSESSHPEFAKGFSDIFRFLHDLTGEHVLFFSASSPPKMDEKLSYGKSSIRELALDERERFLKSKIDFDKLVFEICTFFDLEWNELPAVVISNDIWSNRAFAVTKLKSPSDCTALLEELVNLSTSRILLKSTSLMEYFRKATPNVKLIKDYLPFIRNSLGLDDYYNMQNYFEQENDLYNFSKSYKDTNEKLRNLQRYKTKFHHNHMGRSIQNRSEEPTYLESIRFNHENMKLSSIISVPAEKLVEQDLIHQEYDWLPSLEKDSQIMFQTGTLLVNFYRSNHIRNLFPNSIDFTPFLINFWKLLERELNLSIFEAMRKQIGIPIPEYYQKYMKDFTSTTVFKTIDELEVNLNSKSKLGKQTIGHIRSLFETMIRGEGLFNKRIIEPFGLNDDELIKQLKSINKTRNNGVHNQIISESDFSKEVRYFTDREKNILKDLVIVKNSLKPIESVSNEDNKVVELESSFHFPDVEQFFDEVNHSQGSHDAELLNLIQKLDHPLKLESMYREIVKSLLFQESMNTDIIAMNYQKNGNQRTDKETQEDELLMYFESLHFLIADLINDLSRLETRIFSNDRRTKAIIKQIYEYLKTKEIES